MRPVALSSFAESQMPAISKSPDGADPARRASRHRLLGVVIFGLGLFLANLAARAVGAAAGPQANLLSIAARVAILLLTGAMALRQMGLANEIINLAFGLILGAAAIAFAIAFGLGGRDAAGRQLEGWIKSARSD